VIASSTCARPIAAAAIRIATGSSSAPMASAPTPSSAAIRLRSAAGRPQHGGGDLFSEGRTRVACQPAATEELERRAELEPAIADLERSP